MEDNELPPALQPRQKNTNNNVSSTTDSKAVQIKEATISVYAHTEQAMKWFGNAENDLYGLNWEDVLMKFVRSRFMRTNLSVESSNVLVDASPHYTIAVTQSNPQIPRDVPTKFIWHLSLSTVVKIENVPVLGIHHQSSSNRLPTMAGLYKTIAFLTLNPESPRPLPVFNHSVVNSALQYNSVDNITNHQTINTFLNNYSKQHDGKPLLIQTNSEQFSSVEDSLSNLFRSMEVPVVQFCFGHEAALKNTYDELFKDALKRVEKEGSCVAIITGALLSPTNQGDVLFGVRKILQYCQQQRIVFIGISNAEFNQTLCTQNTYIINV